MRLGAIAQLRAEFGLPVGLSDHSPGIWTALGAVALGACVLEKHFTVTRSWPGPDVPLSIEPSELGDLVRGSQAIWEARGGSKDILPEEQPVIDFAYACVVTIRAIRQGEAFSLENTWVKRPGTGEIHATELSGVLGRVAARDLPAGVQITRGDLLTSAVQ
jgi:N-acetylneuraminate synthase